MDVPITCYLFKPGCRDPRGKPILRRTLLLYIDRFNCFHSEIGFLGEAMLKYENRLILKLILFHFRFLAI